MICFDKKCIDSCRQLFSSGDSDSNLHYEERHETLPIHKGPAFFKNLNIEPFDLPDNEEEVL